MPSGDQPALHVPLFPSWTRSGPTDHQQPLATKGPIIIEDEVWLGFGVIILSGVRIGKGAIVGTGSVLTKDVPSGAIAVGVPAHVVRMRAEARDSDRLMDNGL